MYLSILNNEKKHLFLELEIYMSKIDGDFSNKEKVIIDTHCMEMHIDNNNYECEFPLDYILSKMANECSKQEKHIIFLEMAGTVLADDVYHSSEKKLIEKLADVLEISATEIDLVFSLIKNLKDIYKGCSRFVKEA